MDTSFLKLELSDFWWSWLAASSSNFPVRPPPLLSTGVAGVHSLASFIGCWTMDFGSHTGLIIFIKIGIYQRKERNHVLLTTTLSCLIDLFFTLKFLSKIHQTVPLRRWHRKALKGHGELFSPPTTPSIFQGCGVCVCMRAPELHVRIIRTALLAHSLRQGLSEKPRASLGKA